MEAETETAARSSIQTLYKNGDGTEENGGVVFFSSVRVCMGFHASVSIASVNQAQEMNCKCLF